MAQFTHTTGAEVSAVMPHRIQRSGKFLTEGEQKFYVKGVSYGTFPPDAQGYQFPPISRVADDFARMRDLGINTIRTYTTPRLDLLDEAQRAGLRVMAGIFWPQFVAFLEDAQGQKNIRREVTAAIRSLRNHESLLMVALGNEIPASVVRWHGRARIERFLHELYEDAKAASPETLFTYVNFPPTEFLELPFLDVCAFNVYLHHEPNLRRYLARLQHVAGNLPLLISEAGADSMREGLEGQAALTSMQVRTAFSEGACGAIAYAWTDEWWCGGQLVDDWAFGLVDRDRRPKPAADAVAQAFAATPFHDAYRRTWPKVSVVVCAYNAADTLEDCLSSLAALNYPDYEVVLVDDGSKDDTEAIARRHPWVRLIRTPNNGLSAARNIGLSAARGEIVAYTDADVRADSEWLAYLVQPFITSDVVAVGGPNVVPADDHWMAQCVARAPGGPTHVLFDDRIAEHVPGCNLAVRRDALLAIGGFNPIFLRAGDDVDVCWRLQGAGGKIGFAPAALVWHHHRASIGAYWRQQVGYGEGEVWLRPHHPDKFSGSKIHWRGQIYSPLPFVRSLFATRINAGTWGTAPFPSVYRSDVPALMSAPYTLAWQIASVLLMLAGTLLSWTGSPGVGRSVLVAGLCGVAATIAGCVRHALASDIRSLAPLPGLSLSASRLVTRGMIAWLHFLQPIARARGRLRGILSSPAVELAHDQNGAMPAWHEVHGVLPTLASTHRRLLTFWSESGLPRETLLTRIVERLRSTRVATALEIDGPWDLGRDVSLQLGQWGRVDVKVLIEYHGRNRELIRVARRLRVTPFFAAAMGSLAALAVVDATTSSWVVTVPVVIVLAMMARAASLAVVTVAFADQVMTRAIQELGAIPLLANGRSSDPDPVPPRTAASSVVEPARSQQVPTVRHAS